MLLAVSVYAGSAGTFLGVMVSKPDSQWIYVRSRNGMLRRVDVSSATVSYGDAVPAERRTGAAANALLPGVEVRITAEQDSNGEWRATQIQITGAGSPQSAPDKPDTPDDKSTPNQQPEPVMTLSPNSSAA